MLITNIKAIAKSIVTWLVIAQFILTIIAEELATLNGSAAAPLSWIARALVTIGVIISIIRRVAPVLPEQVGLTLPSNASPLLSLKRDRRD